MITLGIETSCDETALCIIETEHENHNNSSAENSGIGAFPTLKYRILANIIHSQIDLHREFGGVFPMLAKREHIKNLPILYKKLLEDSGIAEKEIGQIAVTHGPGLEPALWTGIVFAKELGLKLALPVIPVNHMEGHIVASLFDMVEVSKEFKKIKHPDFPAIAVLISGGHTEIVAVEGIGKYKILGSTLDDAIGEAFDKVARMMNLPYPGGPEISKFAEMARIEHLAKTISLPRPMIHSKDLNFSFSGLKTAVLYLLKEKQGDSVAEISDILKKEIAREFEDSVTEVLISKTRLALLENEAHSLIVGGGVIANRHIREAFIRLAKDAGIPLYLPASGLSGDNALMIALAGILSCISGTIKPSEEGFIAKGNLSL